MGFDPGNRNVLTLLAFSPAESGLLFDLARNLEAGKRKARERQRLAGKNIALIFDKPSTRTRRAFEVAAVERGANVTCIGASGPPMGVEEPVRDTARVLARMCDGIECRGFDPAESRMHAIEAIMIAALAA